MNPGDIVTEEPTEVGAIVLDVAGVKNVRTVTGRWCSCGTGIDCTTGDSWRTVAKPARLFSVPEPVAPESVPVAEEWQPVEPGDVRVGDEIEMVSTRRGRVLEPVVIDLGGE